jgi:hypothetical protein
MTEHLASDVIYKLVSITNIRMIINNNKKKRIGSLQKEDLLLFFLNIFCLSICFVFYSNKTWLLSVKSVVFQLFVCFYYIRLSHFFLFIVCNRIPLNFRTRIAPRLSQIKFHLCSKISFTYTSYSQTFLLLMVLRKFILCICICDWTRKFDRFHSHKNFHFIEKLSLESLF